MLPDKFFWKEKKIRSLLVQCNHLKFENQGYQPNEYLSLIIFSLTCITGSNPPLPISLLAKITGLLSFTVISDSREQCTFLIHMHWLGEYVYFLFLPKLKQTP